MQSSAFPAHNRLFSPPTSIHQPKDSGKGQWGRDPIDTFEIRAQTSTNYSSIPKPLTTVSGQYNLQNPRQFRSNVFVMDGSSNYMSPTATHDESHLSDVFCPTNILSAAR